MTPHTLIASVLVLLAGATGLMWPKSNPSAQYFDAPTAVRTIPYHLESPPVRPDPKWLPHWLGADATAPPPAWRVRGDGVWVPWTLDPPAWLTTIAAGYVVAETVPTPPERPAPQRAEKPLQKRVPRDVDERQKSIALDVCERHGLKKTYTDRWRWRCR